MDCWFVAFQNVGYIATYEQKGFVFRYTNFQQRLYECLKKRVVGRQWIERRFTNGINVSVMAVRV
jgi:hypothetical protein